AVRQRHLAAAERHLVAGDGHGLEDRAPDHALGVLVEVREVVAVHGRGATSSVARNVRRRVSSDWESTWCGSFRCETNPESWTLWLRARTNARSCVGEVCASPSSSARSARSTSAIAIALRSECPKDRP